MLKLIYLDFTMTAQIKFELVQMCAVEISPH